MLLALPGAVLASLGLYLVTLAGASFGYRPSPVSRSRASRLRLAVVVPAHDEELLVARCVQSLFNQDYPADRFRVVVVSDNSSDSTASIARSAGAEVMVRDQPDARGKGHALRWATDRLLAETEPPDAIVIVDADSVADPLLLAGLAAELEAGHEVVQADYTLLEESGPVISEMARAGFLLFHRVRFLGRARLGMAANLVGNGMLFSRRVLDAHPWTAFTGVEDLEQSIHLRLAGIRPRFAPAAHVAGPGPASGAGALRQRLRWEGGRFHVVRRQLVFLIRTAVVRRDPRLLDAAIDLATPPLALLSLSVTAGALLSATSAAAGLVPWWAAAPWAIAVVAIPLFVVIGLWSAGAPAKTWRILLGGPMFMGWKLVTYLRLLRGHDVRRWDRTDRVAS
ncbi:MAG TPA: glycosyltransferase family 2 protein [Candidatus Dormibacteraeota bacterium]